MTQPTQPQTPTGRLGPRPLGLHLAVAQSMWLSSLTVLPLWKSGLPSWNPGGPLGELLQSLSPEKTDSFSGADVKAIVDQAVEAKLRAAFKSGTPLPLTTKDLLAASKKLKPTTREWFSTARNYALYSNQGGVYDDVLKYLKLQ